jgi:hypothetical protein
LPATEYVGWQRSNFQQKYAHVLSKTDIFAFGNETRIIPGVVIKTIQILDSLFVRAQAQQVRKAQMDQKIQSRAQR